MKKLFLTLTMIMLFACSLSVNVLAEPANGFILVDNGLDIGGCSSSNEPASPDFDVMRERLPALPGVVYASYKVTDNNDASKVTTCKVLDSANLHSLLFEVGWQGKITKI